MSEKNISLHKQFLHTFWDSICISVQSGIIGIGYFD